MPAIRRRQLWARQARHTRTLSERLSVPPCTAAPARAQRAPASHGAAHQAAVHGAGASELPVRGTGPLHVPVPGALMPLVGVALSSRPLSLLLVLLLSLSLFGLLSQYLPMSLFLPVSLPQTPVFRRSIRPCSCSCQCPCQYPARCSVLWLQSARIRPTDGRRLMGVALSVSAPGAGVFINGAGRFMLGPVLHGEGRHGGPVPRRAMSCPAAPLACGGFARPGCGE